MTTKQTQSAREVAARAGETHYQGSPCPDGHTMRYVSTGSCVRCTKDSAIARNRAIQAMRRDARKR